MFENVVGHEFQKQLFGTGKVYRPSYIFEGVPGVGKFMMAKEIARFYGGNLIQNSYIVDGDLSVDNIRSALENSYKMPYLNKHRTIIINDADKMNVISQNTLLKALESPSPNCHFILIVSDQTQLLDTIVSRCDIVKFYPIATNKMKPIIKKKFDLTDDTMVDFIVNCCRGNIGRILSSDDLSYYQNLAKFAGNLAEQKLSINVLPIAEIINSNKETKQITDRLVDVGSWFKHCYTLTFEERYLMYSKIIIDTLVKITGGANVNIAVEVMVMRILKYNAVSYMKESR